MSNSWLRTTKQVNLLHLFSLVSLWCFHKFVQWDLADWSCEDQRVDGTRVDCDDDAFIHATDQGRRGAIVVVIASTKETSQVSRKEKRQALQPAANH